MGADLELRSVIEPFVADKANFRLPHDADPVASMETLYNRLTATGGYFRNGYNSGDIMWVMGLSWNGTVLPMLDAEQRLPIERAGELIALIEANPMSDEQLAAVYLEQLTNGVEPHPVGRLVDQACGVGPKDPPDFAVWAGFVRRKRNELLTLLRKSIALGEPLYCSL